MANSREASLQEEKAIFTPIPESSAEFYHSERERCVLESLMSSGPGGFYMQLSLQGVDPFLSPSEVMQLSQWAQEEGQQCQEDNHEDQEVETEQDFSSNYWPQHSDLPAPDLELGWPEKYVWPGTGSTDVYTSPPSLQAPPLRVVVRRLLQGASKVIAMVTDRLTDNVIVGDLYVAATRNVPVYILLNWRSAPDSLTVLTVHKLKHQNIRVRVLGGRSFHSRHGKIITGELKDNFLLVDMETVMLGSYSMTWADAHLHRQLVTVQTGPVVQTFDQEFRILYASSLPVPDTWPVTAHLVRPEDPTPTPPPLTIHHQLHNQLLEDPTSDIPPPDSPVDWKELGVTKAWSELMEPSLCEIVNGEPDPLQQDEYRATQEAAAPHPKSLPVQQPITNWSSEPFKDKSEFPPQECEHEETSSGLCRERNYGIESNVEGIRRQNSQMLQKKPLILRVPVAMNLNAYSLSGMLKGQHQNTVPVPDRCPNSTEPEKSPYMWDISSVSTETHQLPRLPVSGYERRTRTPALALMEKRTNESRPGVARGAKDFLSLSRPRSSTIGHRSWEKPEVGFNEDAL